MTPEISLHLAGIIGPMLIALSISEYKHLDIWKDVHPTLVYLNGLILLVGGLIVVRLHNLWVPNWPLIITILGWLLLVAGAFRMFFPKQKQLDRSWVSSLLLLVLLSIGCFLTLKAYVL